MPRITDFCSSIYVLGCRLSVVRLCDSDFGITPVDDITIGIIIIIIIIIGGGGFVGVGGNDASGVISKISNNNNNHHHKHKGFGPLDPFRLQSYSCSRQRFFGLPIVLLPCGL